jgi:hypothetical protein
VIRTMIDRLWKHEPHYIRLVETGGDKRPPKCGTRPPPKAGVASARWIEYDKERIFELLPAVLTEIHGKDRFGSVVMEADSDPALRCAYPYDHRVFVMPVPSRLEDVFRNPSRAAVELQRVLDDTASFASEIFGLFAGDGQADSEPSEDRPHLTHSQMRNFLYSPLGDELATRIQLQPPYHGLVESDVVVVNTGVGRRSPESEECLRRIKHLLDRARSKAQQASQLFFCDPCAASARMNRKLLAALKPMCAGGK